MEKKFGLGVSAMNVEQRMEFLGTVLTATVSICWIDKPRNRRKRATLSSSVRLISSTLDVIPKNRSKQNHIEVEPSDLAVHYSALVCDCIEPLEDVPLQCSLIFQRPRAEGPNRFFRQSGKLTG